MQITLVLGRSWGKHDRTQWTDKDTGEEILLGAEIITETTERITLIRQRLLAAQSRQKKYADKRRTPLTFAVGNRVFIRVSSRKGLQSARKLGKLAPRFVRPFEITERIGAVAYRLALPPQFSAMHDVFHVSALRKYVHHKSHILDFTGLSIQDDISIEDHPRQILCR